MLSMVGDVEQALKSLHNYHQASIYILSKLIIKLQLLLNYFKLQNKILTLACL